MNPFDKLMKLFWCLWDKAPWTKNVNTSPKDATEDWQRFKEAAKDNPDNTGG